MFKLQTLFAFFTLFILFASHGVRSDDDFLTLESWPENSENNEWSYETGENGEEDCSYEEEEWNNCEFEEYDFVDNKTCLEDDNCHRNVTVCHFEGCCAWKECDENGECLVAMPDCIPPEEIENDEDCLYDDNCHRNVTVCHFGDCCAVKECDENGECIVMLPDCDVPEDTTSIIDETETEFDNHPFVDNKTCLEDDNCHRNVTVCHFDGCCAWKECDENGECLVAMPDCIPPEEIENDEDCLYDDNCHRNVTVCHFGDCCAVKECDENGECIVMLPDCDVPEDTTSIIDEAETQFENLP